MTRTDVQAALLRNAREVLADVPDEVLGSANLHDDLNASSLDVLEIVLIFEQEAGCVINDDGLDGVVTLDDLTDVIIGKLGMHSDSL